MKRKNKNVFKLFIVLFVSSLFLINCEQSENIVIEPEQSSTIIDKIPYSNLPNSFLSTVNGLSSSANRNSRGSEEILIVSSNQVVRLIDSLNNTKYSVKFSIANQPSNVLYNLILGTNSNNEDIEPFVLKYTIDNINEVYEEGTLDLSKMKGKIAEYTLDGFLSRFNNFDRQTDTGDSPCNEYTNNNNSNSTGGGGGIGDYTVTFESTTDNSSGDSVSCNLYLWSSGGAAFALTWECADGTSGYQELSRNTDETTECPGKDTVPINGEDEEEDGASCKSFNFTNTTSTWQESAVVNIKFNVYLLNDQGVRYLYTQSYPQPILFGAPANLFNGGNLAGGLAAEASARALNKAINETIHEFRGLAVSETAVDLFFKERLKDQMATFIPGGRAQFNSSTALPPTQYQTYAWFADDCTD